MTLAYIQIQRKKRPFLPPLQDLLGTVWGPSSVKKSLPTFVTSIRRGAMINASRGLGEPQASCCLWGCYHVTSPARSSASPTRDGDQPYLYHKIDFSKNHEVSKLNLFHLWIRALPYQTKTGHHSLSTFLSFISYWLLKHRPYVSTDVGDTDNKFQLFLTI